MIKRLIILLITITFTLGQSSFDILNTPTDTRGAALGINLNPTIKPSRIITDPENTVTLNVWNWVADIQGAYMGIGLNNTHISVQAMHSGELEYRNDLPSEEPISTFQYTLFNVGGAYAKQMGDYTLGIGTELIYERTLNASSKGLSFNLALAYILNENLTLSGGIHHVGSTGKLDEESTALPAQAWTEVDARFGALSLLTEINSGPIPFATGFSYTLLNRFEFMGGLQLEPTDSSLKIYPSAGFTATWTSFNLGYTIYQMNHNLGPRHFITLYWNY